VPRPIETIFPRRRTAYERARLPYLPRVHSSIASSDVLEGGAVNVDQAHVAPAPCEPSSIRSTRRRSRSSPSVLESRQDFTGLKPPIGRRLISTLRRSSKRTGDRVQEARASAAAARVQAALSAAQIKRGDLAAIIVCSPRAHRQGMRRRVRE
jgi:hypothetical protein